MSRGLLAIKFAPLTVSLSLCLAAANFFDDGHSLQLLGKQATYPDNVQGTKYTKFRQQKTINYLTLSTSAMVREKQNKETIEWGHGKSYFASVS